MLVRVHGPLLALILPHVGCPGCRSIPAQIARPILPRLSR